MNKFMAIFRKYLRILSDFSLKNRWVVLVMDLVVTLLAAYLTESLHNRYQASDLTSGDLILMGTLYFVFSYLSFYLLQTYRELTRHLLFQELGKICLSLLIPNLLLLAVIYVMDINVEYPFFFILNLFLLNFILMMFLRYWLIMLYSLTNSYVRKNQRNTFIYGIGPHSVAMMQWVNKSGKRDFNVKGFVVRNHGVKKTHLQNLPIYNLAFENVYKEMFQKEIAVLLFPDYKAVKDEQEFLTACLEKGISVMVPPPIEDVEPGGEIAFKMKPIQFEDLLGREEISINMALISEQLDGKTILVTGAAGSIGSELVRQLTQFKSVRLILYDSAETPLHSLRLEMEQKFPYADIVPIIGDVRNTERLDFVFRKFNPQVAYHAAAYKHVPLMELNPCEAVLCNDMGTKNVADYAVKYGIERFIMVSTDKAVNPTNIMGASKRIAEIYIQSLALDCQKKGLKTIFVTTRFGNVLGSNGSVIPHFKNQIEKGGPVTVTHPDIIRYFMTIPEACRLMLEAGSFARTGEIYVFDMGKPVKIVDLARRMIEMAGMVPERDIEIKFIGLREGEKLYEELLCSEENNLPTTHNKIMVASVRQYDYDEVVKSLDKLIRLAYKPDIMELVRTMKLIVPEFKSKNSPYEVLD